MIQGFWHYFTVVLPSSLIIFHFQSILKTVVLISKFGNELMSSYIYKISIYDSTNEIIFGDLETKKARDMFQGKVK